MASSSEIEWTDATWNPVRGCTKISAGCKNCYAERFAERFRGVAGHPFEQGFDLRLIPSKLTEPLKWKAPKRIFVNSMSDLFHDEVPDSYIDRVVDVMREADWHVYQVLSKRASRLCGYIDIAVPDAALMSHVWWGVSVEDRKHGLPRIDHLRQSDAAVRFLSVEPLLEDLGDIDLTRISWVIVGGESGPRARPMNPAWVERVYDQCREQSVPFFFKQWGGTRKKITGRTLHGRTYDEMPLTPAMQPAG
jgi:protein gp37